MPKGSRPYVGRVEVVVIVRMIVVISEVRVFALAPTSAVVVESCILGRLESLVE